MCDRSLAPEADSPMKNQLRVSETLFKRTQRIQPRQANYPDRQNVHGGEMVRVMDDLAAVPAMTLAQTTVVTAHISSVDFLEPIPVGHVAEMTAYVYDTGDTSLHVYAAVDHRNPRRQGLSRATEACFVMVAVDAEGNPQSVPGIRVEDSNDSELLDAVPC